MGEYNIKFIVSGSGSKNLTDYLVDRKYIIKVFTFDFGEFVKVKGINYFLLDLKVVLDEYLKLTRC